ncbi:FIST N-terminal domain-containing protein [Breoghania sp.]|uniref:FIST N-terminal domain-containing protein n=1 Tax=Breoghania sp. TaxID=2065378 RepID=UPI0026209F79|nr:FIST N-terminal domain-containing protein [Breoghania sp.]MDJ0933633.1 FIST N-terminal domain-containing protein [Breoghania sp.]
MIKRKEKKSEVPMPEMAEFEPPAPQSDAAPHVKTLLSDDRLSGVSADNFRFDGAKAALVVAYISPHIGFAETVRQIQKLAGSARVVATTTAGELCSSGSESVYCGTAKTWRSVVLQIFSRRLIDKAEVFAVPLHCQDIRSGGTSMDREMRIDKIRRALDNVKPSFSLDPHNSFALTSIDGLSNSENYFMEAVYRVARSPCVFVVGSAGGTSSISSRRSCMTASRRWKTMWFWSSSAWRKAAAMAS